MPLAPREVTPSPTVHSAQSAVVSANVSYRNNPRVSPEVVKRAEQIIADVELRLKTLFDAHSSRVNPERETGKQKLGKNVLVM